VNTVEKFGLKKSRAVLLFVQMILTVIMLAGSIYLLVFVTSHGLGGWMIVSYIFITLSILSVIVYSVYGYKRGDAVYQLSILPFLVAVFINVLLPNRETLQVALLTLLFALTFGFLLRQKDRRFSGLISVLMVVVSLVFSIYSAAKADTQFLGDISSNWPTYVAMYLSIFIPSIMSGTFALTYRVRTAKRQ